MSILALTKSKHLIPFATVLRRHGESVEPLLRMANLPAACLDDPEMLVPVGATTRFRELCARKTGLHNIAITATDQLGMTDLGKLGQALLSAPTLQQSLFELGKLIGTQSSNLAIEMHPQPTGHLAISHRVVSECGRGEWHRALYTLSWILKIVRLADPDWSPSEIWLDTQATPERFEVIESLGSTARFGQPSTGFLVPASMLALPVAKSPAVQNEQGVEEDQFWSTSPSKRYDVAVQQMIRSYIGDGWLSIEEASEVSNTSVRTMQRRLTAEHTTYSKVVQATRAEMAGELLVNTDGTLAEIAHELGYRHQGDFTRAFRRWAGLSPSEFRRRRRYN